MIRKLIKPKWHILYNDKLLRMGRGDDCKPLTFDTEGEAEAFILDHRANELDKGTPCKRWHYYIFLTDTNMEVVQG